jgi:anti-sigma regulatory factor (Ser/Thr protein kinase)
MDAPTGLVHQALLYGSDPEFVAGATRFLKAGAARGEPALVVTTAHNIALLRDAVGTSVDVDYVDAARWYLTPGITLGAYYTRIQEHSGPGRLRVIGEPVWTGRSPREIREWKRYESVVNMTLAHFPTSILCPYDTRSLPDGIVDAAVRTHPELAEPGGERISDAYQDPVAFFLECDSEPLAEPGGCVAEHPIEPGSLVAVRRFLAAEASRRGLAGERLNDLVTAANEVATNVLDHGGRRGRVRVWDDGDELVCDVLDDSGRLADPLAGHRAPDPSATHGHGLWLVRQLCDLVEIRNLPSGLIVRLRMSRREPPGAGHAERNRSS